MELRQLSGWVRLALAVPIVFLACAHTARSPEPRPSGFLDDYSKLEPGPVGRAQLVYIHPTADFSLYSRIWIEPVTIWRTPGSSLEDLDPDEAQRLADHLAAALRRELAKDWELVDAAGPGTLRLRSAITEAEGSQVLLDVVSTISPPARVIGGARAIATNTRDFVGRASGEFEILDSVTGERLAAGVDGRTGIKTLAGVTSTWADVESAYDLWARLLRIRLGYLRGADEAQ